MIGAAWDGDPLLELDDKPAGTADGNEALIQLARQQGMNTDVRRSIFTTLMTSEVSQRFGKIAMILKPDKLCSQLRPRVPQDYVDASEKVTRLGLTAVQQREIVRVLLHCLGNVSTCSHLFHSLPYLISPPTDASKSSLGNQLQSILHSCWPKIGQ